MDKIARVRLVDAELRMRGSSLEAWSARHGLTPDQVVEMAFGRRPMQVEAFSELRDDLGIDLAVA